MNLLPFQPRAEPCRVFAVMDTDTQLAYLTANGYAIFTSELIHAMAGPVAPPDDYGRSIWIIPRQPDPNP